MFLLIFFALILLYVFNNFYWKRRNYPPGPTPLPLVGNLPQLIKHLPGYNAFLEWHKEFDGIFTFWNAETPVVIVTDYDLIQKHFIKDAETFSGRQNIGKIDEYFKGGKYGIVFTDGEKWKEQRRFALHVLRDLGMSRPIMEQKIMLELEHFTEMIDEKLGTNKTVQIDMIPIIEVTVANIINQILFGFAHHDPESCQKFAKLKDLISEHMATVMQPFFAVSVQAPNFFEKLPYFKEPLIEFRQQYDEIAEYLTEQIEKHKKNVNFDGEFTDFVDAYLKEMKKGQEYYTQKQLTCILYDLWIGGQETTAYTTIYSLICALNFPKTLQKIHEELDKFGTKNRKVTLADKQNLVYCQAFINETQRLINLLPMNLNHRVTKDTIIKGYKIKENTVIIPQISCVLFDERYFPDPMSFKPERFIDENGQLKKIEQFIPFSIGKRQCLGESLGKMELFLIITNFFNSYSIKSDTAPSMEKDPGCTVRPRHFKCNIQKLVSV